MQARLWFFVLTIIPFVAISLAAQAGGGGQRGGAPAAAGPARFP